MKYITHILVIIGIVNFVLIIASTLGAVGFLGLPKNVGIRITEFMHKALYPRYFVTGTAYYISIAVITLLIVLLYKGKIVFKWFIIGLIINSLWIIYHYLLKLN